MPVLLSVFLSMLACAPTEAPEPIPAPEPEVPIEAPVLPGTGNWRGWLDSPGGELPFGIELSERDGKWQAWILNPPERIEVDDVRIDGTELILDFSHYDARITATWSEDGRQLEGEWTKTGANNTVDALPFHGRLGRHDRFQEEPLDVPGPPLAERWAVDFASSESVSIGLFEQRGRVVLATFLTDTGDYRYLSGTLDGPHLRLSVFDGAHAFLFDAMLDDDGKLDGHFWSRQAWHETWSATPNNTVKLADPMGLTRVAADVDWSAVRFPDLDGASRTLADPAWSQGPHLIQIMGTWCPNCNDSTDLLVELQRKYAQDGLNVVSLAFEHSGQLERDTQIVRTYKAHHGAPWTYLVAGLSDKEKAGEALPFLDSVRAYPTLIFVDKGGAVHAVHTGFVGPAAPVEHAALRATYERLIHTLLE